jgi:hypothetical protein
MYINKLQKERERQRVSEKKKKKKKKKKECILCMMDRSIFVFKAN